MDSNTKTIKGNAIKGITPFIILTVSWYLWIFFSPDNLVETHPILIFSIYGLVTGFFCTRLVLNRVCGEPCNYFYYIILPLPLIAFNSLNHYFGFYEPFTEEFTVLISYLAWVIFFYTHMILNVIKEITECLNIYCLSIKNKKIN